MRFVGVGRCRAARRRSCRLRRVRLSRSVCGRLRKRLSRLHGGFAEALPAGGRHVLCVSFACPPCCPTYRFIIARACCRLVERPKSCCCVAKMLPFREEAFPARAFGRASALSRGDGSRCSRRLFSCGCFLVARNAYFPHISAGSGEDGGVRECEPAPRVSASRMTASEKLIEQEGRARRVDRH